MRNQTIEIIDNAIGKIIRSDGRLLPHEKDALEALECAKRELLGFRSKRDLAPEEEANQLVDNVYDRLRKIYLAEYDHAKEVSEFICMFMAEEYRRLQNPAYPVTTYTNEMEYWVKTLIEVKKI